MSKPAIVQRVMVKTHQLDRAVLEMCLETLRDALQKFVPIGTVTLGHDKLGLGARLVAIDKQTAKEGSQEKK